MPLTLLVACAALGGLTAVPAQAVIIPGEFGVQQRAPVFSESVPKAEQPLAHPLAYHGGPVVPALNTYVIYWDPNGVYRAEWMRLIDRYMYDVGADSGKLSNVFALDGQYTGLAGTNTRAEYNDTFRGAYTDTKPYPAANEQCPYKPNKESVCITDEQIRKELKPFVYTSGLPYGLDTAFFVLTPPGVNVCTEHKPGTGPNEVNCSEPTVEEEMGNVAPGGICGYHSVIERTSAGPIVYAVQPWVAGNAGTIVNPLPVETTNPTPPVLACQNGAELIEPNQVTTEVHGGYETGLADVIINDLSIEQSNIVVDPLLNGWYQVPSQTSKRAYEQSDICQWAFSPAPEEPPKAPKTTKALDLSNETINGDKYYLQWAFASTGVAPGKFPDCWQGDELTPHFTSPNPVNAGDIVAFDANESGLTLDVNFQAFEALKLNLAEEPFTLPSYSWNFGDGTPAVTGMGANYASVFHTYQYGGKYTVTLTVTDSGGHVGTYYNKAEVNGPPPPGSGSGSGTTSTGGTVSPTGTVPSGVTTGLATPTVYDFFPSHSLTKVLRQGLPVRYAVNEQVAGSMEVMLDSRTAKRLHVRGPLAKGLPKGYPRSIVLRGALLVTTQAGHGTLRVIFPRSMAQKLAHAHRLKLTIRIKVRNADRLHPQTTTLLSTVVLKG